MSTDNIYTAEWEFVTEVKSPIGGGDPYVIVTQAPNILLSVAAGFTLQKIYNNATLGVDEEGYPCVKGEEANCTVVKIPVYTKGENAGHPVNHFDKS